MTEMEFNTNEGRFRGEVVKTNWYTVWVRYKGGVIKRHRLKHRVTRTWPGRDREEGHQPPPV